MISETKSQLPRTVKVSELDDTITKIVPLSEGQHTCGASFENMIKVISSILVPLMIGILTVVVAVVQIYIASQQRQQDLEIATERREQDLKLENQRRAQDFDIANRTRQQQFEIEEARRDEDRRIAEENRQKDYNIAGQTRLQQEKIADDRR
ncbi:unnamed protein product [Rotaria sp. Silwood2]|nr:unnamed protein product [Rotaria sp. Silwood2]